MSFCISIVIKHFSKLSSFPGKLTEKNKTWLGAGSVREIISIIITYIYYILIISLTEPAPSQVSFFSVSLPVQLYS